MNTLLLESFVTAMPVTQPHNKTKNRCKYRRKNNYRKRNHHALVYFEPPDREYQLCRQCLFFRQCERYISGKNFTPDRQ